MITQMLIQQYLLTRVNITILSMKKNKIARNQTSNIDIYMQPIQEDNELSDDESQAESLNPFYSNSRMHSLAIQMEKRDAMKQVQNLRQIHKSKLKIQKKMLSKIADSMTSNRVDILKNMFKTEMLEFMKQYNNLLEVIDRQVYNENIRVTLLIEQENVLSQRKILCDLIKEHDKTFKPEDNLNFKDALYSNQLLNSVKIQPANVKSTVEPITSELSPESAELRNHDYESMKSFSRQLIEGQENLISELEFRGKEISRLTIENQQFQSEIGDLQNKITRTIVDYQEQISKQMEQYSAALVLQAQLQQHVANRDEQIKRLLEQLGKCNPEEVSKIQAVITPIKVKLNQEVQTEEIFEHIEIPKTHHSKRTKKSETNEKSIRK